MRLVPTRLLMKKADPGAATKSDAENAQSGFEGDHFVNTGALNVRGGPGMKHDVVRVIRPLIAMFEVKPVDGVHGTVVSSVPG